MQIPHSDFQDQLIRGLSHKLNNILSLFHGYLGMLMEGKDLDESTQNGLIRIKEGADAASEIVDRTRSLARPSSLVWRSIPTAEFFFLNKLAIERCMERDIRLEIDCAENLPDLWTDVSRLRTVMTELVKNAVQASEDGTAVRIVVRADEPKKGRGAGARRQPDIISISVCDSGHGVAPEIQQRVFQPFFTTRHDEDGHGLGLTLAAGIVQQLGGSLNFESTTGDTVFLIKLPVVRHTAA
jgi:two-component system, cell cycle sensor histidine kinase and response regulator CckA